MGTPLENPTGLEEQDDGLEIEEEPQGLEEEHQSPDSDPELEPTLPDAPPAFETPFGHPDLQGKSPEEIEAMYDLAKRTIVSQSQKLNEQAAQTREPESSQIDEYMPGFKDVLRQQMSEVVAPITEEVRNLKVERLWQQFRDDPRYPEFAEMEPSIRTMIENAGADVTNPNVIHITYLATRGARGLQGNGNPSSETSTTPPTETRVAPIKTPSSTPITPGKKKNKGLRRLTEEEDLIRKQWKMSVEEYLELMEADPDKVLGSRKDGE